METYRKLPANLELIVKTLALPWLIEKDEFQGLLVNQEARIDKVRSIRPGVEK